MEKLFDKYILGDIELKNRMVMAPMTRSRAGKEWVQTPLAIEYYSQRAGAGLIISEATGISAVASGYSSIPGIFKDQHIEAWKPVTDAVHKNDGTIFCQLWHTGRVSHPINTGGLQPLAPSAIRAEGQIFTYEGLKPMPEPRAMIKEDILTTISDYSRAAINAMEAGFDGVELHNANGYLPHQFLSESSNKRDDEYGGSIENRCRFTLEVLDGIIKSIGSHKVGIRLSPSRIIGPPETDPKGWFSFLLEKLNGLDLAYVHTVEPPSTSITNVPLPKHYIKNVGEFARKIYRGTLIVNGGFNKEKAENALQNDLADLISFGVLFLANPDLPRRFIENAPLNEPDRQSFYRGGAEGYIDYPFL